jgi:hypothetical protein
LCAGQAVQARSTADFLKVHHFIIPNRCSVDGSGVPTFFRTEILPMMMPNIAILMASSAQSAEPGFQILQSPERFALQANVLSLINNLLKQDQIMVVRAALPAVMHLVIIEVRVPQLLVITVGNILASGIGEIPPLYGRT